MGKIDQTLIDIAMQVPWTSEAKWYFKMITRTTGRIVTGKRQIMGYRGWLRKDDHNERWYSICLSRSSSIPYPWWPVHPSLPRLLWRELSSIPSPIFASCWYGQPLTVGALWWYLLWFPAISGMESAQNPSRHGFSCYGWRFPCVAMSIFRHFGLLTWSHWNEVVVNIFRDSQHSRTRRRWLPNHPVMMHALQRGSSNAS